jgi:hypothetical protein
VALTELERVKVRKHLGYLNVASVATFALGVPANIQTQFVIEPAMDLLLPQAEGIVRQYLEQLDAIEFQVFDDADTLVASKVGSIDLNPVEFEKLLQRYDFVRQGLANALGVFVNPYDRRFYNVNAVGGVNAQVMH